MSHIFEGVGVALITPFKQDTSVDYDALGIIVDNVIEGGVDFLVALGTTAETPTLTKAEKLEVLQFIIKHNNGRKSIVAGIGGNNTQEIINTIGEYPMDQLAGILSVAPYYNKPNQEGLYQHFKAIALATDKPIILYNVPGRTSSNILPETAIRLAKEFNNIVAIKEASGSIPQCMELVHAAPEHFAVLSGDDLLVLAQIGVGMKGIVAVAANAYAKDFSAMVHSALRNDMDNARQLFYSLFDKMNLLYVEGNPTGIKCTLHLQGVCQNVFRLPLVPASTALQERISKSLK